MAYITQDQKKQIATKMKPLLKKFGLTGTLSISNHSTLVLTVKSGKIDFIGNLNETCSQDHYQVARGFKKIESGSISVNRFHYQNHFTGEALDFIDDALDVMKSAGWYDDSDMMTDYFNTAYYLEIKIGKWDRPYVVV